MPQAYGGGVTPLLLALLVLAAPPAEPPRDKLRFGLDYRWWGRNLQFTGAPEMPNISAGPLPTGVTFDIQWFPASHFVDDWRADVGMTLRADIAPYFTQRVGDAGFQATVSRMRTGLMYRVPFHHVEPSVNVGFQAFEATTALWGSGGAPRPHLPNESLAGPRLGLGLRVLEFWRVTFDVGGGAAWLMGTGELGSARFFPGAKGSAFDANLGLAFRTWSFLDLRLGVDVTVHSIALASGKSATDAYYGFSVGAVFKGVPLPGG